MKIRLSIFFFFLFLCYVAAQSQIQNPNPNSFFYTDSLVFPSPDKQIIPSKSIRYRLDSVYVLDWKTSDETWGNSQSTLITYDSLGREYCQKNRYWNGGRWVDQTLMQKTYNFDDQLIRIHWQFWDQDHWSDNSRNLYTYFPNGSLDYYLVQVRDSLNAVWLNKYKYEYGFDNEGNWTSYLKQTWSSNTVQWISEYRFLYSYENRRKTEMIRQNWNIDLSGWVNSNHIVYTYDSNGILQKELNETWDSDSLKWDANTLIRYVIANRQVKEKIYQTWKTESWANAVRYLYEYNLSGKTKQIIYFIWDNPAGRWVENTRYLYDYLESGDLSNEIWQKWNSGSETWINDLQVVYYFSSINPLLEVSIVDSSNIECFGDSTGWALAEAMGGTPPYSYQWDDENQTTDSIVYGLVANRIYHVAVTDAVFSTAKDSVILNQPAKVETGPIIGDTLVEYGEKYNYSVPEETGSVYLWQALGGVICTGQGTHYVTVKWNISGQGILSVVETNSAGCIGDTSYLYVFVGSVGIPKSTIESAIRSYPNPFSNEIVIELPLLIPGTEASIQIFDINGRMLKNQYLYKVHSNINAGDLTDGLYLIKILYQDRVYYKKIQKKSL